MLCSEERHSQLPFLSQLDSSVVKLNRQNDRRPKNVRSRPDNCIFERLMRPTETVTVRDQVRPGREMYAYMYMYTLSQPRSRCKLSSAQLSSYHQTQTRETWRAKL